MQPGTFFENLYTATTTIGEDGREKTSDHFELPNLNVRVTLIYSHPIKPVEVNITFEEATITNYATEAAGNNERTIDILHKGKNSIYSDDANLSKLYTRVLRPDWDDRVNNRSIDTYRTKQANWTYYDMIYKSYYMFVISDAYYVIDILNSIVTNNSDAAVRAQAIEFYSYITTFNPLDYEDANEKNKEYLFDNDRKSTDMYTYDTLKSFIADHAPDQLYKLPSGVVSKFMKITTIDIASMIEKAIDINFIYNHFKQTDLVISSFELNEMFYIQRYVKNGNDEVYDYVKGFNYFFDVQSAVDATFASNAFTVSTGTPLSTNVGSNSGNASSSQSTPVKNIDKMAQEYASFFQVSKNRASSHNFFAFAYSSIALTEEVYYSEKEINTVNIGVYINPNAVLKTYVYAGHPSYNTKDVITAIIVTIGALLAIASAWFTGGQSLTAFYIILGAGTALMAGAGIYNGVASYNTSKRASTAMSAMRAKFFEEGVNGESVIIKGADNAITGIRRLSNDDIRGFIENEIHNIDKQINTMK